jgi:hypothetical protein
MQIEFESEDGEARTLRGFAERRLRFAVRRLAWLVPRATVRLSDEDGPRPASRCRVELLTHTGGTIVVTALARDFATALDTALMRAGRALARAWARTLHRDAPDRRAPARSSSAAQRRKPRTPGSQGSPVPLAPRMARGDRHGGWGRA